MIEEPEGSGTSSVVVCRAKSTLSWIIFETLGPTNPKVPVDKLGQSQSPALTALNSLPSTCSGFSVGGFCVFRV